ncbi:PREDICTED: uncharacterized protein LOC109175046 [Ipomoea nil]|uniref:uncharacterized protein LOC109175046 n=1 Tax=Ipomoea nil TaxID=35883 RepID=UPI000901B0AA|nr:PREDICTED: uncharacterized protein LOC109175046 [Ipomoea nil]
MDASMKSPELDGHNYSFSKARMEIYLQAQGTRVYRTVLTGWSPPTIQNADGTAEAKPIDTWTEEEMTSSDLNNKALSSIVGSLHESVFTLVTGIQEAKRVWDTLETRYEGTSDVKQSKLQLVLSEFESLRMSEEETISTFHSRVQNLMNRASVLGEPFTDEKVVKKILQSLPKRFRMKVTAIQEHSGWEKKPVGELMGSLHTYELEVLADDEPVASKKGKSVAFVAEADRESDTDEIDDEALALLTKNFKKILKGINRRSQGQPNRTQYKSDDFEERHTQLELEFAKLVGSWEQLVKVNKSLNEDLKQRDDLLKKLNTELVTKEDLITQIRSREGKLIKELEDLKKNIKMMDTTSTLDKILDSGRNPNDKKGLGFERGESSKTVPVFIKEGTSVGKSVHSYEQGQTSRSVQIKQKGIMHTQNAETETGKVWVRKSEVICYPTVVLTASMTEAIWYFDNGCSRHMTRNVKCLMAVQPNSGWVYFLREKSEAFNAFKTLCTRVQKEKDESIIQIQRLRSDHGKEFENSLYSDFYSENGIAHEFSAPRTAQQNGVVERKNRTL